MRVCMDGQTERLRNALRNAGHWLVVSGWRIVSHSYTWCHERIFQPKHHHRFWCREEREKGIRILLPICLLNKRGERRERETYVSFGHVSCPVEVPPVLILVSHSTSHWSATDRMSLLSFFWSNDQVVRRRRSLRFFPFPTSFSYTQIPTSSSSWILAYFLSWLLHAFSSLCLVTLFPPLYDQMNELSSIRCMPLLLLVTLMLQQQ